MIGIVKVLTTIGSVVTMGFGVWHFFVPVIWKWNSYIDSSAAELVLAVQAINIFFSLSLVLFGTANMIFIHSGRSNSFSIAVFLSLTVILWVTRTVLQIVQPQGSINPWIQYSMLLAFVVVTILFAVSLALILFSQTPHSTD